MIPLENWADWLQFLSDLTALVSEPECEDCPAGRRLLNIIVSTFIKAVYLGFPPVHNSGRYWYVENSLETIQTIYLGFQFSSWLLVTWFSYILVLEMAWELNGVRGGINFLKIASGFRTVPVTCTTWRAFSCARGIDTSVLIVYVTVAQCTGWRKYLTWGSLVNETRGWLYQLRVWWELSELSAKWSCRY